MKTCLMLHGIGEPRSELPAVEWPYWIPQETFYGIIELMRTAPAQITIDDGNATDVEIALPALVDAGLSATFFIPTDRIGENHYLTEAGIRALHAAGMEVASHGCSHLRWTTVSDAEIAVDVARSIERLAAIIGAPVRSVAVPYGDCDRRVLRVLRSLGVGRVYSSFRGPDPDGGWLVRRDCVTRDMTLADVAAMLTSQPSTAETALNFLRIWRRAGHATLRKA
ncbi:MAG TPA: polysaccharide deacetylase family protein [Rhizomicrobium sp.]|nr:polysaccharide deacetylase family protein [Rhizomicrobium sp.]